MDETEPRLTDRDGGSVTVTVVPAASRNRRADRATLSPGSRRRDSDRVERAAVGVTAVIEHARRAGIGGRVGIVDAVSDEQHVGGLELEHGQVAREEIQPLASA